MPVPIPSDNLHTDAAGSSMYIFVVIVFVVHKCVSCDIVLDPIPVWYVDSHHTQAVRREKAK